MLLYRMYATVQTPDYYTTIVNYYDADDRLYCTAHRFRPPQNERKIAAIVERIEYLASGKEARYRAEIRDGYIVRSQIGTEAGYADCYVDHDSANVVKNVSQYSGERTQRYVRVCDLIINCADVDGINKPTSGLIMSSFTFPCPHIDLLDDGFFSHLRRR